MDYTSVKEKLIQSWRYQTLAVIKHHKNHLSFSLIWTCFNVYGFFAVSFFWFTVIFLYY